MTRLSTRHQAGWALTGLVFCLCSWPALVAEPAGEAVLTRAEIRRIARLSPLPELPPDPSNAVADDPHAAHLGRLLFFETRLSADRTMSCATCHDPDLDWTDGRVTASPDSRFPKNAPSLWNSAYNRWFAWDGRADSAWSQALGPIENDHEMAGNRLRSIHLVGRIPELRDAYAAVWGDWPSELADTDRFPADARPTPDQPDHPWHRAWATMSSADRHLANQIFTRLGKAIAAFERGLVIRDSPFDRFVANLDLEAGGAPSSPSAELGASAIRGLRLFVGEGQCTLCHSGPTLSDGEFHDVGIALGANGRVDPGRHRGVIRLLRSPFHRAGRYADANDPTAPIQFLERRTHQLGQFKTPTLRQVARTAPYMHDGRFATLTDVVRYYSTREGALPLGHPTTLLQPLDWTDDQIADVVAFLESLTAEAPTLQSRPASD